MNQEIDDRLRSLANMAKNGLGFEKRNAEELLKKICAKRNLDYDTILEGLLIRRFNYKLDGKISKRLAVQVLAAYAMLEGEQEYYTNKYYIGVETTYSKWQGFLVAIEEVRRKYNKQRQEMLDRQKRERNLFFRAFLQRHKLFYPYPTDGSGGKSKRLTRDEILALYKLAEEMGDDLQVHKQIKSKN